MRNNFCLDLAIEYLLFKPKAGISRALSIKRPQSTHNNLPARDLSARILQPPQLGQVIFIMPIKA